MCVCAHVYDHCVRSGTGKLWPMGQTWPTICVLNSFLEHRHTDSFTYCLRLFLCYNRPKSQKYLPSSTLQKKHVDPVLDI